MTKPLSLSTRPGSAGERADPRVVDVSTQLVPCGWTYSVCRRAPERLVVEGYRNWLAGTETLAIEFWEDALAVFRTTLGPVPARVTLSAFSEWIGCYHHHAARPLRHSSLDSHRLCRDECLAVALISALQNDDRETTVCCLQYMVSSEGVVPTGQAAFNFAAMLLACGQRLLPVSFPVIADCAQDGACSRPH